MNTHESPVDKFDKSVSMLCWGLNEEDLVEEFLEKAFTLMEKTVDDFEIVFVDDGSSDRMPELLNDYAKNEPRLKIVIHEKNMNVGLACRSAVMAASKEYLFWQTVDWSYDIKNLRLFLELLNYFDVVQGIRPVPIRLLSYVPLLRSIYRVNSRSDNIRKALVSLSNYYLLRILYRVPFQDFQNVTFYPTKLAQSCDLQGRTSFINPELLFKTYMKGATFLEVPIHFIPRSKGLAKGTKLPFLFHSAFDILNNWVQWGWKMKPNGEQEIFRVSAPFFLNEDVLKLVVPLFKEFRPIDVREE